MLKLAIKAVQQKKTHDAAYDCGLVAELFNNLPENLLTKLLTLTTCKMVTSVFLYVIIGPSQIFVHKFTSSSAHRYSSWVMQA